MNSTVVLIIAAVLVFLVLPINAAAFSILSAATLWLLHEANQRRVGGRAFTPAFRSLLWAAAVFAGLLGIAAGALSVLVLMDKNAGWGGILLFFSVPICFMAAVGVFAFAWYARYRPAPDAPGKPDELPT